MERQLGRAGGRERRYSLRFSLLLNLRDQFEMFHSDSCDTSEISFRDRSRRDIFRHFIFFYFHHRAVGEIFANASPRRG